MATVCVTQWISEENINLGNKVQIWRFEVSSLSPSIYLMEQ